MALRWLLHSACHVLGHRMDDTEVEYNQIVGYPNGEQSHGEVKSLKGLSQKSSENSAMEVVEYPNSGFQMPLHYPRYTKEDYKKMEEWKVELLLQQYGLRYKGTLEEKRAFAMGAFLWPDQY